MSLPPISIITPNYNGKHLLSSCFESLFSCDYPNFEVILVDNGSTDGSAAWTRRHFPKVRVIALDKNLGYGGAINIGSGEAKGKYLLFLNNDVKVEKDFLAPLVSCLEEDEKTAAAQPKIYLDEGKTLESTGSYFNLTGFLEYVNVELVLKSRHPEPSGSEGEGSPSGLIEILQSLCSFRMTKRDILRKVLEKSDEKELLPLEVFTITGAAMVVRRDLFAKLGGFDEDFFIYSEDHDLCWRLKSLGFKIRFVPGSVVYHQRGATSGRLPGETVLYYSFRNRLTTILKNLDWPYLPVVTLLHLGLTFLGSLALLAAGKFRKSLAIWQGILWNFTHLPTILAKRAEVFSSKKIPDAEIVGFKKKIPVSYLLGQLRRYIS